MTLCVAWIREAGDSEELIFATDSTLTGGEKWNSGVKLFELPRKDCLLCFAGRTQRAYPLILNLISSIRFDSRLQNQHTDIAEVVEYLSHLFTRLVSTIISEIAGEDVHLLRAEARFLFGGWSWMQKRFRIWELSYSKDAEGFIFTERSDRPDKTRIYAFLGDPEAIAEDAVRLYKQEIIENDKVDDKLDMEPLAVLIAMARDKSVRPVDGAPQLAKIYRSGTTEFFGVLWQSVAGSPHFLGREITESNKPKVRYFDPDSCEILEDSLPTSIAELEAFAEHADYKFILDCYPDGTLKDGLTEVEKMKLFEIFREEAYPWFIRYLQNPPRRFRII